MTSNRISSVGLRMMIVACWIAGAVTCVAAAAPGELKGRVVDETGGVAGAKVWVIPGDVGQIPDAAVAEAVTDEDGRFAFTGLWDDPARSPRGAVNVFARDRSGRVGWELVHPLNLRRTKIRLAAVTEVKGRIVNRDGAPIAGLEVIPRYLTEPRHGSVGVALSPDVAAWHAARTDTGGAFRLRDIPVGMSVSVVIGSPRFARPRFTWDPKRPVEITLDDRLGSVGGRLVPHEGPGLAGTHVIVSSANGGFLGGNKHYQQFVLRSIPTGQDGSFRCDGLPPGTYDIQTDVPPEAPFEQGRLHGIEVGPGADVAALELRLQRLPVITGRVVDAVDGQGLAGVSVAFRVGKQPELNARFEFTTTDAKGYYRYHRPPDLVEVVPMRTKTHTGLRSDVWARMMVATDQRWPDLKMARAAAVEGLVIDSGGRPVPRADVFVFEEGRPSSWDGPAAVTGAEGSFRLEGLVPDGAVSVLARTTAAATAVPVAVQPAEQKDPVRLVVEPGRVSHIRGTVTDQAGTPVMGAMVGLYWTSDRFGGWASLEKMSTDGSGRFVTRALWPGYRYRVRAASDELGESAPREVIAQPGGEHDLGRFDLIDP
jgi:protocatechuate 3,4-dioxygenase beta subunit